eukprot:jgi/Tetstr1/439691/TSEL_028110.t1
MCDEYVLIARAGKRARRVQPREARDTDVYYSSGYRHASSASIPASFRPAVYTTQAAARQAVNQSILVELAKGKTRVPNNDLPVSCPILNRRDLRQLVSFVTDLRENIAGMFNGLDDFTSKLVAYFYTNAHLPYLVMRHCTKLHISLRDHLLPKYNAELAQLIRRTFDVIPDEQRSLEYTMVGVILAAIPDSAVNALEAAARRANEQLDTA